MALSKDELVQLLVKQIGLNGPEAREMIEKLYGEVTAAPEQGGSVGLAGNGEFRRRSTAPEDAVEPAAGQTRAAAKLPPRRNAGEGGGKTPRRS